MGRLVTALVVLGGLLLGLNGAYTKAKAPSFLTAPVEYGSVTAVVSATGTVEAEVTLDVSSQLSGQIAKVFVNFNDAVTAGQPLAELDQASFLARVAEANAALKMATAAAHVQKAAIERAKVAIASARTDQDLAAAMLEAVKARNDEAQREYDRKSRLALTGNVPDRDLSLARTARDTAAADLQAAFVQIKMKAEAVEMAEADSEIAAANLDNADAVVDQKQALLDQAQLDLQHTVIRSPIDGIILDRSVDPGQTVAVALDAKTLFTIANSLGSMEVHGRIDEADVGQLRVGQTAYFTVDAYPDRTFTGKVLQIRKSSEVVQNVVTYTTIVSAANPEELLFPNMTAEIQIVIHDTGKTLRIPNQALRFQPNLPMVPEQQGQNEQVAGTLAKVWVIGPDGNPAPISVKIGESDDNATQLIEGPLTEGQPLIIGVAASSASDWMSGIRFGL